MFGADIDYAMLHKLYKRETKPGGTRCSPAKCIGTDKRLVIGDPEWTHILALDVARGDRKVETLHYKALRLHAAARNAQQALPEDPGDGGRRGGSRLTVEEVVGLLDRPIGLGRPTIGQPRSESVVRNAGPEYGARSPRTQ